MRFAPQTTLPAAAAEGPDGPSVVSDPLSVVKSIEHEAWGMGHRAAGRSQLAGGSRERFTYNV